MKRVQWNHHYKGGYFMLTCLVLVLFSCEAYNFSQPQPADKENQYTFPKELQGSWTDSKNEGAVYIGKQFIEIVDADTIKVIAGAWPKLDDSSNFIFTPNYNSGFKTIMYDSLKRPIDTTTNYLFRGNYIYEINDHGLLGRAYLYQVHEDTTNVFKSDTTIIELGRKAFLRRLDKNFWILNISNQVLGIYKDNDYNQWWQIVIIEKRDDGHLYLWYCTGAMEMQPSMFYSHNGDYYLDGGWSAAEMMKMMRDSVFKIGSGLIRDKK